MKEKKANGEHVDSKNIKNIKMMCSDCLLM